MFIISQLFYGLLVVPSVLHLVSTSMSGAPTMAPTMPDVPSTQTEMVPTASTGEAKDPAETTEVTAIVRAPGNQEDEIQSC